MPATRRRSCAERHWRDPPGVRGLGGVEIGVLLDSQWVARLGVQRNDVPLLELRRNGRVVAQVFARDVSGDVARVRVGPNLRLTGDVLYTVHDALNGGAVSALAVPAWWRARRVVGAVESRDRPEVRGWILDPANPEQHRRAAIHIDGCLRAVVVAAERRDDIGRWQESGGHHGFLWRIPEAVAATDGTRIEVFDADTGRSLRGSPARVEGGRVVRTEARGR